VSVDTLIGCNESILFSITLEYGDRLPKWTDVTRTFNSQWITGSIAQ